MPLVEGQRAENVEAEGGVVEVGVEVDVREEGVIAPGVGLEGGKAAAADGGEVQGQGVPGPTTKKDVVSNNAISKLSPALPPTATKTTSTWLTPWTWYNSSTSTSTSPNGEFHSDSEKAQHAAEVMTDHHGNGEIVQRDSQPKDGGGTLLALVPCSRRTRSVPRAGLSLQHRLGSMWTSSARVSLIRRRIRRRTRSRLLKPRRKATPEHPHPLWVLRHCHRCRISNGHIVTARNENENEHVGTAMNSNPNEEQREQSVVSVGLGMGGVVFPSSVRVGVEGERRKVQRVFVLPFVGSIWVR